MIMKGFTVSSFLLIHAILFVIGSLLLLHRTNELHQEYEYETSRMNILQGRCNSEVSDEQIIGELKNVLEDMTKSRPHRAAHFQSRNKRQLSMHGMVEEILHLQEAVLEKHCQQNSTICTKGHKGSLGVKGFRGITGSRGELGDVGRQGQTGTEGVKGQPGGPGEIGAPGGTGTQGIDGVRGRLGTKGDGGDIGAAGVKGDMGLVGFKGQNGEKGSPGAAGDVGTRGQNGTDGPVGGAGALGPMGQKGEPGPAGPPGAIVDRNCTCQVKGIHPDTVTTKAPAVGPSINGAVDHTRILDPVQLTCLTTPSPDQTITWEKIGVPMSARYDVTTDPNILSIPEVYAYDTGRYRCTATSKTGATIQATISLKVDGVTQYDCSFEVDTCNWKQSTTDDVDWARFAGATPSTGTGPTTDHTVGHGSEGYYMYLETSSYVAGYKADLVSPTFDHTKRYCVSFWYNMNGIQVADLHLIAQENGGTEDSLWTISGNKGATWHSARVQLVTRSQDYNLIIRAIQGRGYHGDIAIDDVTAREGSC